MPKFSRPARWALMLAVVAVVAAAFAGWHFLQPPPLPPQFASGNGRLEATEFDIATKLPGRLAQVDVQEGDEVRRGQILARIDTADLEAALREAQAQQRRAVETEKQARAQVARSASELAMASKTVQRSRTLAAKGLIARETLDLHETQLQTATAALDANRIGVRAAQSAIEAAAAAAERIRVSIDESALAAPADGRVLYRLAEPGEVLGAGGKVLTLVDLTDVFLPIFLPTEQAGRVRIGADVRIVFDALPGVSVPAKVSFVAARAQFTPKEVETRTEREKLMFRVKVRIDPELLRRHRDLVKSGVPGVAYVRLVPDAPWPAWLPPSVETAPPSQEPRLGAR